MALSRWLGVTELKANFSLNRINSSLRSDSGNGAIYWLSLMRLELNFLHGQMLIDEKKLQ